MQIHLLDHLPASYDELVRVSSHATFYHTRTWLESVTETRPRVSLGCLVAGDVGAPSGVLPYIMIDSGPIRRAWSLPFGTYGGPITREGADVAGALMDRFARIRGARVQEMGCVDFHNRLSLGGADMWEGETQLVDLQRGFEDLWENGFARDKRKRARQARKAGIDVTLATTDAELAQYHAIYAARVREFRTHPPHPLSLFRALIARGGEHVRLYLARDADGTLLGGHFNFYHQRDAIAWAGMTSHEGDRVHAGTLLYARCFELACEEGFSTFNLGASLGRASLVDYKASLGGRPHTYRGFVRRGVLARAFLRARGLVKRR